MVCGHVSCDYSDLRHHHSAYRSGKNPADGGCSPYEKSKWFLTGISALLSIACGVIIITSPFSSTAVLWMFTGVSLIVEAIFDVVALFFGGREAKTANCNTEPGSVAGEAVEE